MRTQAVVGVESECPTNSYASLCFVCILITCVTVLHSTPVVLDHVQAAVDTNFDSFWTQTEPLQSNQGSEEEREALGRAQAQRVDPGLDAPLSATNTAPAPGPALASVSHPVTASAKTAPIASSSVRIALQSASVGAAETARPFANAPTPAATATATTATVQASHPPCVVLTAESLVRAPPADLSLPASAASALTPSPALILPPAVASTVAPVAASASTAPASAFSLSFNFSFRTPLLPGLRFPLATSGSGSRTGAFPRLEHIDSNTDAQDLIQHRVIFSIPLPTPLRTDNDVVERLLRAVDTLERGSIVRAGDVEWAAPVAAGVFPLLQYDSGRLALVMQLRPGMRVKSLLQAVHKHLDWQASPWAETEVAELSARFGSGAGNGAGPGPHSVCRNVFKAVGGELPGAPRCKNGATCKFSHDLADLHKLYQLSRDTSAPPRQEVVPAPRPSARSAEREVRRRSRTRSRSRERDRARWFYRHSRSRSRSRSPRMSVAIPSSPSSHQEAGQPRAPVRVHLAHEGATSRLRSSIPATAPRDTTPAAASIHQASSIMDSTATAAPPVSLDGLTADNLPWRCTLDLLPGLVFPDAAISLCQATLQSIDAHTTDLSLLRRRMVVRHVPPRRPLSANSSDVDLRADLNLLCTMMKQGIAHPNEIEWVARVVPCAWSRNEHWVLLQLRPAATNDIPIRVARFHTANPSRPDFDKLASWCAADLEHLTMFYSATTVGAQNPCIPYFMRTRAEGSCKFEGTHRKCSDSHSVADVRALMEKRTSKEQRAADTVLSQTQPRSQPQLVTSTQPESKHQCSQVPMQAVVSEIHSFDMAMVAGDVTASSSAAAAAVPDVNVTAPKKTSDVACSATTVTAMFASPLLATSTVSLMRPSTSSTDPDSNDKCMPPLERLTHDGVVQLLPVAPSDDVVMEQQQNKTKNKAPVAPTAVVLSPKVVSVPGMYFPFSFHTPLQSHGLHFLSGTASQLKAIDANTDDPLLIRNRIVVSGLSLIDRDIEKSLLSVANKLMLHADQDCMEWMAVVRDSPDTAVVQLRPAASLVTGALSMRKLLSAARRDMKVQSWCAWEAAQLSECFGLTDATKTIRVCPTHFSDITVPTSGTSPCVQGVKCTRSHRMTDLQELYRRRMAFLASQKEAVLDDHPTERHNSHILASLRSSSDFDSSVALVVHSTPTLSFDHQLSCALFNEAGGFSLKRFDSRSHNQDELNRRIVVRYVDVLSPSSQCLSDMALGSELMAACLSVSSDLKLTTESIEWITRMPTSTTLIVPEASDERSVMLQLRSLDDVQRVCSQSHSLHHALNRRTLTWSAYEVMDLNLFNNDDVELPLCTSHFSLHFGHRNGCKGDCGNSHSVQRADELALRRRQARQSTLSVTYAHSSASAATTLFHENEMVDVTGARNLTHSQPHFPPPPTTPTVTAMHLARYQTPIPAPVAYQQPFFSTTAATSGTHSAHYQSPFAVTGSAAATAAYQQPFVGTAATPMDVVHYQTPLAAAAYPFIGSLASTPASASDDIVASKSPFLALHLHPDGSTHMLQRLSCAVAYSSDMEVLRRRLVIRNEHVRVIPSSGTGLTDIEAGVDLRAVTDRLFGQGLMRQDEIEWIARSCAPSLTIRTPAVVLQIRPHVHAQRARDLAVGCINFIVEDERRQLNGLADPIGKSSRICRYRYLEMHLGSNSFIKCNDGARCEWSHSEALLAQLNQRLDARIARGEAEPRLCAPLRQRVAMPLLSSNGSVSATPHTLIRRLPPSC